MTFSDHTTQRINFEPILHGEVYGALREHDMFNRVILDPEIHTLVWPNGADFDPETLHDWPQHGLALQQTVEKWGEGAVTQSVGEFVIKPSTTMDFQSIVVDRLESHHHDDSYALGVS